MVIVVNSGDEVAVTQRVAHTTAQQVAGAVTVTQPSGKVTVQQPTSTVTVKQTGGGGGVPYTGAYEVAPTTETQTLTTNGRVMTADVTVHPIPSNYGLITWDGTSLTVS